MGWVEAIHPDDRERVLESALTKQISGRYDEVYRIVRPDGAHRWIHDRAFPIRDDSGEVYRLVGIAEDITRRRKRRKRCGMQRPGTAVSSRTQPKESFGRRRKAYPHRQPGIGPDVRVQSPEEMVSSVTDVGREIMSHPKNGWK